MPRTRKVPRVTRRSEKVLAIDRLLVSPNHPRKDQRVDLEALQRLVASMEDIGFFGAITVTKMSGEEPPIPDDQLYLVEDGLRRICARHLLGHAAIPAIVCEYEQHDTITPMLLGFTVNMCRRPLDLADLGRLARLAYGNELFLSPSYCDIERDAAELALQSGDSVGNDDLDPYQHLQLWQERDNAAASMDAQAIEEAELELAKFQSGQPSAVDSILPRLLLNRDPASLTPAELYALALPVLVGGRLGEPASVLFGVNGPVQRLHAYGEATGDFEPYTRARLRCQVPDASPITGGRGAQPVRPGVYTGHEGPLVWEIDAPKLLQLGFDPSRETFETEPVDKVAATAALCEELQIAPPLQFGSRGTPASDDILGGHTPASALPASSPNVPRGPAPERASVPVAALRDETHQDAMTLATTLPEEASQKPAGYSECGPPEASAASSNDALIRRAALAAAKFPGSHLPHIIADYPQQEGSALVPLAGGVSLDTVTRLLRRYRIHLMDAKKQILRLQMLNVAIFGEEALARSHSFASLALTPQRYREITPFSHQAADLEYFSRPTVTDLLAAPPGEVPLASPSPDGLPSSIALERLPAAGVSNG